VSYPQPQPQQPANPPTYHNGAPPPPGYGSAYAPPGPGYSQPAPGYAPTNPGYGQQAYPAQAYQAPTYPAQAYPAQAYAAQTYQAQTYQAQTYPAQTYPAQTYPAQGYPAQTYPAQGYQAPAGQPAPRHYGQLSCRFCGCVPAADVTFRGHQGMIVLMRFLHLKGPFCRDCGLATFRRMTEQTLIAGWWGYASAIIAPVTVLINVSRRGKVAQLAPPRPNPAGQAPGAAPMNPGKPLLARPVALIGLALPVVAVLALLIAVVASSH
jgi:hypothetical protein